MDAIRLRRTVIVIGSALAALGLAYHLRAIFNPLLLALALAYILNPAVRFLERRRMPRKVAIGLLLSSLLLGVVALLLVVIPSAWREARAWAAEVRGEAFTDQNGDHLRGEEEPFVDRDGDGRYDEGYAFRLHRWIRSAAAEDSPLRRQILAIASRERLEAVAAEASVSLRRVVPTALSGADEWASSLWKRGLAGVGWLWDAALFLVLTPIYLAFLLESLDRLWAAFVRYLPAAIRPRTLSILGQIDLVMSAFFRGRLLVCTSIGLVSALGFWLLDIRFGLFFGLASGFLSLIPFLNILAFLPVLLSCWADGASGTIWALAIGVYCASQALDPLLTTWVLGKDLQLHPVTIVLSLFVCAALFGFFGMLLAVPIVAAAKILAREFLLPSLEALAAEAPDAPPRP